MGVGLGVDDVLMLDVKLGSVVFRLYWININASKARSSVNVIVSVVIYAVWCVDVVLMLDVKLGSVIFRLYWININASKARPSVNVIVSVVIYSNFRRFFARYLSSHYI